MKTNVMKLSMIASIFLLFTIQSFCQVSLNAKGGMINLNDCKLRISEIVEVQELPSPAGAIKPSVKTNKILKVKISGIAPVEGSFIAKTHVFSALYSYRQLQYIVPTFAIGVKGKNAETGEIIEKWNTEADNLFTMGFDQNSKITFDIAFEVPKEVKEIEIQVPMIVK